MTMQAIFLWNGWHAGDMVMMRPLIRHILNENDIQITVGCYRNYAYLFADLGVVVIASDHDDFDGPKSLGALDLSYLCPDDHIPINTWVGNYPELTPPSWPTIVETFNRQAREQGHPIRLKSGLVPDIDFRHMNVPVRENAIYIENGTVRSGHSVFSFDMQRLSGTFPALNFYCTAHPFHYAENMYNCSHLNLVELSALSNRCVALIGKGSGPFCCTLTDANRYKPRGIMRFHDPVGEKSPSQYRFWDYPGSPLEYLNSEDDLIGFLNRVVERRKTVLL